MNWTTDKPTRPGYYWLTNYREAGFDLTRKTTIVHAYRSLGHEPLTITFTGNEIEGSVDELIEAEWYGPLPIPPEGIDNSSIVPPVPEDVTLKGGPFGGRTIAVPSDLWYLHIWGVEENDQARVVHQYRRDFSDMKVFNYDRAMGG